MKRLRDPCWQPVGRRHPLLMQSLNNRKEKDLERNREDRGRDRDWDRDWDRDTLEKTWYFLGVRWERGCKMPIDKWSISHGRDTLSTEMSALLRGLLSYIVCKSNRRIMLGTWEETGSLSQIVSINLCVNSLWDEKTMQLGKSKL